MLIFIYNKKEKNQQNSSELLMFRSDFLPDHHVRVDLWCGGSWGDCLEVGSKGSLLNAWQKHVP